MSIQSNINSIIGSVRTAAYLMKDLKVKKDITKIQDVVNETSTKSKAMYRDDPDKFIDKAGLRRARISMSKSFKGRKEAEVSLGTRQEEIQYMKDLEESRAKGEIGF